MGHHLQWRLRVLAAALCMCNTVWADAIAVKMEKAGGEYLFQLSPFVNSSQPPSDAMRVYVDAGPGAKAGLPPLLGSYAVKGNVLSFRPRFPLQAGGRYRVVFNVVLKDGTGTGPQERAFEVAAADASPGTVVEQIYPTADVLPENQLKFYLHFSAAMSRGEAYMRVHLLDEGGKRITLPFLELDQELWDRAGRRLTIFFDPARVKRGLLPHEEAGVPIEDGKSYTLVVAREWLDARGKQLERNFEKRFRVGPADREPPRLKDWMVMAPKAGGRDPVIVEFPESLDYALLGRLVRVTTAARRTPLDGEVTIDHFETRWSFTPDAPWTAGRYSVEVGTILEDLAGNTLERPFEVDVFERVQERVAGVTETIGFEVK